MSGGRLKRIGPRSKFEILLEEAIKEDDEGKLKALGEVYAKSEHSGRDDGEARWQSLIPSYTE